MQQVVGMRPRKASKHLEPALLDKMSTLSANTQNTASAIPPEQQEEGSNCYRMLCGNRNNEAYFYGPS